MNLNNQTPDPEVPTRAKTRTYTAAYKARILSEYDSLDKAGKGALLRREGLVRREAPGIEGGVRPSRLVVAAAG